MISWLDWPRDQSGNGGDRDDFHADRGAGGGAGVAREGDEEKERGDDLDVRAPRTFKQQRRKGRVGERERWRKQHRRRGVADDHDDSPEREYMGDGEQQLGDILPQSARPLPVDSTARAYVVLLAGFFQPYLGVDLLVSTPRQRYFL